MVSRSSILRKLQRKNLPQVEVDVYSKVAANSLVVYSIYFLEQRGITATVEDIVSTCFKVFPHSFGLKHYPRWPDSAMVIRRLNDIRAKGLIKGSAVEGYAVKYQGKLLALRTAKALGLVKPAPKKKSLPAKKKVGVKPITPQVSKKRIVKQPKTQAKKNVHTTVIKKKTSAKPIVKSAVKKIAVKPKAESKPIKKRQIPAPVNKTQVKKKPVQLKLALPPVKEKTVPQKVKPKPKLKEEKKAAPIPSPQVSKEEKAKAGKVIRMLEASDAYKQFKKNGGKSKISEFDFRNMLFTTMESSAETLKRNVELFKRYAGIQSRLDLMAFLVYCEGSFESLLKPQAIKPAKKSKR